MKDIKDTRKKYESAYAQKMCNLGDISLCKKEFCYCKHAAEAWAFIDTIIPENFRKLTIMKFDGMSNNKVDTLIPAKIALEAKDKICEYCWGSTYKSIEDACPKKKKKEAMTKYMAKQSPIIMADRFLNGNHVVIFGTSSGVPIGRTLVASIIMKEAIKLRMRSSKMAGHTYGWVDFSILRQNIKEESKESYDYRYADWLVVDNITDTSFLSIKQRAYYTEMLNPFFVDRFNSKLPTILVFKFDIRLSSINIEDLFGTGIASIVNSPSTFKIPLSEKIVSTE